MNELIGKGRPFYSALDMGAKALKRKVGTGSEFMKELMALPGIKQNEIKERGLEEMMGAPKMTHDQFLSHLSQKSNPRIIDKTLKPLTESEIIDKLIYDQAREDAASVMGRRGSRNSDEYDEVVDRIAEELADRHWNAFSQIAQRMKRNGEIEEGAAHEQWTLPGGDNYREMLIKYPMGNFEGVPQHFNGEPNILASMRLMDRKGPNGEKLLHLEELQSDWHQQGRENGYTNGLTNEEKDELRKLKRLPLNDLMDNPQLHERFSVLAQKKKGVPDAPFKKNWEEMAIKRLVHHAAEKGYHGIVMTPGKEQADRYSLSKHIGNLSVKRTPENFVISANDPNGNHLFTKSKYHLLDLDQDVGKELAEKIKDDLANKSGHEHNYSGLDLEIGGEGMKGFYDKKVPNIFNQIGKKHGVQMQLHGHEENLPRVAYFGDDPVEARTTQLHHFPITEPMRQDILTNGLPLYKTGGVVHKAEGGNVQPSIEQMRQALQQNRFMIPKAEIQSIGANEAPNLSDKIYIEPGKDGRPSVGGVDMDQMTPGMQYVQQSAPQMTPPGQQQPGQQGQPPQPSGNVTSPLGGQPSNILSLTPQGQAMSAMSPPQQPQPQGLKDGGQPSSDQYHELLRRHLAGERLSKAQNELLGLYHSVGGGRKISVPIHMMQARYAPDPNQPMVKERMITPEALLGGAGVPLVGDSSRGGELLTHIDDNEFEIPVELQAGKDFMRRIKPKGEQSGWASGTSVISDLAKKVRLAKEFGDKVYGLHATMSGTGADFSSMPTKAVIEMLKHSKILKKDKKAFNEEMKSLHPEFVGLDSPDLLKQLTAPGSGELKKLFLQRMSTDPYQNAKFPEVAKARVAVSHPHLLERPLHSIGAGITEFDPSGRIIKNPSQPHYDYPDELASKEYVGGFDVPMHRGEIFQEWEKNRRMMNASKSSDPRSFDLSTPVQKFDQEWLDKVMPIYLARRKALIGKKKGGKVEDNLDTMRYALSKVSKKAKK